MQRIQRNKKPDAILTSDWHLRETTPICRTDDYWAAQWKKVGFVTDLQRKYNCPVLHAGDLFDHWKPSPYLLSETIKHLPNDFSTVYGQHDLPQHNLELDFKSGACTLYRANKLTILTQCHWGRSPTNYWEERPEECDYTLIFNTGIESPLARVTLVWHIMTYQGQKPWPDCPAPTAIKLLKKYSQYDLIVTGDNHKPFVETYEGRILVNPGSLMRMDADQINHRPRVYLWYADDNTVKPVYLPIEPNVISREHIDKIEKRNERIEAFITTLNNDWEGVISFEENLERFKQANDILPSIMNIVYKSIETNN